jgi:AAA+ superfamily predicted ATPase
MNNLFDDIINFPDPDALERYDKLVFLDHIKIRLLKESELMLDPSLLDKWNKDHHGGSASITKHLEKRPKLFVFAGDVGTGKTALARSFGAAVAKELKQNILLFPLSLSSRGSGAVGEMTQLLSQAFTAVKEEGVKCKGKKKSVIMLIDEADAIAQSRELSQMHHEDKAGVNALLRGVDAITENELPVIIILCTNRFDALDPAVRRRAAVVFEFKRPGAEQRKDIFIKELSFLNVNGGIDELIDVTGRGAGYSHSDIYQRYLPSLVLEAFPDKPINLEMCIDVAKSIEPTKPFNENG